MLLSDPQKFQNNLSSTLLKFVIYLNFFWPGTMAMEEKWVYCLWENCIEADDLSTRASYTEELYVTVFTFEFTILEHILLLSSSTHFAINDDDGSGGSDDGYNDSDHNGGDSEHIFSSFQVPDFL